MDIKIKEFPENLDNKLKEVKIKIDEAESVIKRVEAHVSKAVIPAVNELRYVGRHIIDAITNEKKDPDEEIIKAKNHCN